ncbi:centriolar satellite-associated tubulin polyglutamylase complex regulator 1 isoform X3 [Moschus berezovskii]|uniref:centriolar satellite-associated tubulin polyglutamylase complex regulator 1 isoform X3 n=1 Tax=Moschus berezovskii TaxID=68408 RepID=UPI00244514B1|nr:centriolar satellite-associated tubulin polyglutamylase complex regulator 1 isoform X3 [Moschus berezovskii]
MLSPERLALPDYEYLAQRHVLTYVEDAVCQLLENKEDVSQYGIARFFTEYFNSVCQGTHILFREFSFIQATPHNRASFLRAFWRCFRTVGKNGDLLTMREYHCLLQLLCPDFPLELTQKAARIVLMDDAMDCLMSFSDFLFAFQIQFYYSGSSSKQRAAVLGACPDLPASGWPQPHSGATSCPLEGGPGPGQQGPQPGVWPPALSSSGRPFPIFLKLRALEKEQPCVEALFPAPCVRAVSSQRPEQGSHGEVGCLGSQTRARGLTPEN